MVGSVVQMVVASLHTDIAPVQMVVTSLHTNIAPVQMVVAASPISHPRVHLAGSYRKSRDHVSYVTRSRVNRHVLSYQKVRARQCHLQQPEAPPRPSPRGGSLYLLCLRVFEWLLPLGEGWGGAPMLAGTHPRQLCRSCDYIAQGCGHGPLPWVAAPLILLLCKSCV